MSVAELLETARAKLFAMGTDKVTSTLSGPFQVDGAASMKAQRLVPVVSQGQLPAVPLNYVKCSPAKGRVLFVVAAWSRQQW